MLHVHVRFLPSPAMAFESQIIATSAMRQSLRIWRAFPALSVAAISSRPTTRCMSVYSFSLAPGIRPEPARGLLLMHGDFNLVHRELIISLAARYRVPTL